MNEFARQYAAAVGTPKKYARSGRPPLTEKVQALLAHHADAADGRSQSIISDAIREDGLPFSDEDLEKLQTSPNKLYVHPHGKGYRVLPDPVLTMADIRQRNRDAGHYSFSPESMNFYGTRPDAKVHQGPGGTFFVNETDNYHGTDRESHVRRFDSHSNRVQSFVHPEGRYGPGVPNHENHWFDDRPLGRQDAHALAAHLAEHGRLPEGH